MHQSNRCNRHRQFTLGLNQEEWNSKVQGFKGWSITPNPKQQGLCDWKTVQFSFKKIKSTNRHSNSSKSVPCTSPSSPAVVWQQVSNHWCPPATLGTAPAHRGCLYAMRGAASDCFLPPTAVIVEFWLTASEPLTDFPIGLHTQRSDPLPWIGRSTWKPL